MGAERGNSPRKAADRMEIVMTNREGTAVSKRKIVEMALKALMDAKGRITPQEVVDAARAKGHPLHGYFEWDIRKAARLHWLSTAAELIRTAEFRTTVGERVIVAPYFVRDPDRPADEQGYRSIQRIRSDTDVAHEVLVGEMSLISGVLKRARAVAEVLGLVEDVAEIEAKVAGFLVSLKDDSPEDRPEA